MVTVKLVVGLGNPGPEYAETRHNSGFMAVAALAERNGIRPARLLAQALVGEGRIGGCRVILAQPQTYMNRSGIAVAGLQRFFKIELKDLLVVYDDLDLPLGKMRLRLQGGSGGHRGMRSIIEALGSEEFPRLKVGIGRPQEKREVVDYVLSRFLPAERELVSQVIAAAAEGIERWIREGPHLAAQWVNSWRPL